MKTLHPEALEELRDINYHRTRRLRVETIDEALGFVNQNGLVFAFKSKKSELPCLWHAACGERDPVMPLHTHHDPPLGLVWRAKDELAVGKKIYYGKALKKTPTMISLSLFPAFYATKGYRKTDDLYSPFRRGDMSLSARRILDVIVDSPPITTKHLKVASGHGASDRRYQFDRAMAELQERLLVVKIAENNDPFTFIWGRLDRWLTDQVEISRSISPRQARTIVLEKYFAAVVASTASRIQRLFRWESGEIGETLSDLEGEKLISDRVRVEGQPEKWYMHRSYLQ
jgi:hypothetical protein